MGNMKAHRDGSSQYKGVFFRKDTGKWGAKIKIGPKQVNLGSHLTEVEAALTYDTAALAHWGQYAKTNFP